MKLGHILAVLLCSILPLSCSRQSLAEQENQDEKQNKFSVTINSNTPLVIYYDSQQKQSFTEKLPDPVDFLPYSSQKRPAAFMELDADSILVSVNRAGFILLEKLRTKAGLTVTAESGIAIQNVPVLQYSTGNFWHSGAHTFMLLYTNPVFEEAWLPSLIFDFYGDTVAPLILPQHPAHPLYATYQVFPADPDQWLLQYRYTENEKNYSAYSRWNRKTNKNTSITMAQFEQALTPVQFSKARGQIVTLLEFIKTPVLLEYKASNGTITYISNGNLDDAVLGTAETTDHGTFILAEDGRYWLLKNENAKTGITGAHVVSGKFSVPVESALYTCGLLTDALFIAAWEESLFPDTGRSGLLLLALE